MLGRGDKAIRQGGGDGVSFTIENNLLGHAELRIAGARRKVEDEDVKSAPINFVQQLLKGFHHHQTSPYNRRIFPD